MAAPPVPGEPELDVVETPTSPSSGLALCRFEFEANKGNEGTKILMVEWNASVSATPSSSTAVKGRADAPDAGEWEVSWEGKTTVLPIRDSDATSSENRRVYFLLPPGAPIPTLVTISRGAGGPVLRTKPLPAIFPPGLAGEAREAGTRGVLHTIWAKKRLQELEAEIVAEMKTNSESIGVEMALQERQWIVDHFGLTIDTSSAGAIPLSPQNVSTSATPRSPIGGRLGEKLKGLKLATSPAELAAATQASKSGKTPQKQASPFSPEDGDVAVSSFAAMFRNRAPTSATGVASLNAVMEDAPAPASDKGDNPDTEEELFALPMSPRSPDMSKSPFSIL